ncbi:hypothetical protein ACP8Y2_21345 [Herpetosiphon llansteffanensis]
MYTIPKADKLPKRKSFFGFIVKNTLIISLITSIPLGILMVYVNNYFLSILIFVHCMYLYVPIGFVVVTAHSLLTTFCIKLLGDKNQMQLTSICTIIGMLLIIGVFRYRPFKQPALGEELVVFSKYFGGLIMPALLQVGSVIWAIWHDPDPWDLVGVGSPAASCNEHTVLK